eukprot:scaffold14672_cov61-Attheya_sp.AAC.1
MEGIKTVIQKKRALSIAEENKVNEQNKGTTEAKKTTVKLNYKDPKDDNEKGKYAHLMPAETKAIIQERGDNKHG